MKKKCYLILYIKSIIISLEKLKKNVVISGYPKSGNTWITRLTAEIIDCPVSGFWDSKHNEIAIEGLNRQSNFECFKSHHQLCNIEPNADNSPKIIYVVRDPRDIYVSGLNYFNFFNYRFFDFLFTIPYGIKVVRFIKNILNSKISVGYKKRKLRNAIFNGDSSLQEWLSVSWATHVEGYFKSDILIIKYEDMLENPYNEVLRILDYLSIERTEDEIFEAIHNQSFKTKKSEYISQGDTINAKFLRTGKSGGWKNVFTNKENKVFRNNIGPVMDYFNYT